MKKSLLIILCFVVVSIGLTWFWNEWARESYGYFLKAVGPPIYKMIGFQDAPVRALRTRYINFVPFVSLLLVTPGLALKRRSIGLVLGLFTIFVSHLVLNLTELLQPGRSLPVIPSIASDAFPFFVWIFVAYPVLAKFLPVASEPSSEETDETDS